MILVVTIFETLKFELVFPKTIMVDSKKYIPPIEVIQARREAILAAAREAQTHQEIESPSNLELIPVPSVPARGFPIVLVTTNHTLAR